MAYQYKVAFFSMIFDASDAEPANTISGKFQNLLDSAAEKGWEYYSLEKVTMPVKAGGCLTTLLKGRKIQSNTLTYYLVVFRRPIGE